MQPPHFGSQITQQYNVYVNPYGMRRLSPLFQPGCFDVLCARGKLAYDHEGNRRFRALVKQHQHQYSAATCKYEKSKIVSFIVSSVRNASPQGGFVKNIDGCWFEVGDRHSKEKVGQTFRDLLHNKYSSSTKAKARVRLAKRIKEGKEENVADKAPAEDSDDKKERKKTPDAVASSSSRRNPSDEMRSSVSVVSNEADVNSQATTVAQSNINKELPPLTSVTVKYDHPGQRFLPHVSPAQQERTQSTNLMESLRSGFDPMAPLPHDLEPLPLASSGVKMDFNSSSNSEESFEDVMSEFCSNMGVPV